MFDHNPNHGTGCKDCGKPLRWTQVRDGGVCKECFIKRQTNKKYGSPAYEKLEQRDRAIEQVMLTTEAYAVGLNITERIEIVSAECAFGMNIFKDLFASVRDIVGGRSDAVQNTMRDTRKTALYELKREAYLVGANAVVGVNLNYTTLNTTGNMILLVATGTAVKVRSSLDSVEEIWPENSNSSPSDH